MARRRADVGNCDRSHRRAQRFLAGDAISPKFRPLEAIAPANNSGTAQGDRALERGNLSGITRFDEEVGRAEGTNNGSEEPGPETAQARGHRDGRE
jgi:hypothetical protein